MKELRFQDPNMLKESFALTARREPFFIVASGWRVGVLRKALPLYEKHFMSEQKADIVGKLFAMPRFFLYGILSPTIWGIINSATLHGMAFRYKDEGGVLLLLFTGDSRESYSIDFVSK